MKPPTLKPKMTDMAIGIVIGAIIYGVNLYGGYHTFDIVDAFTHWIMYH